jgi:2-amino-4-hydroxy-6-hydroxymethyldihydropteridine diphosphokinase
MRDSRLPTPDSRPPRTSDLCKRYVVVAIALGSNLGDSYQTLQLALQKLAITPKISLQNHSSWYLTAPVGPPQPNYINGCAIITTEMSPNELLQRLQTIENESDRDRSVRWGPRTLDLDIILYADLILDTPDLQIPHPRLRERAFVLIPLAEIAPEWVEPVSQTQIQELVKRVDCSGVKVFSVDS